MGEIAPPSPNPEVCIEGIPYRSSTFPLVTTVTGDDLQEIDREVHDETPLDDLLRKFPVEGEKGPFWPLKRLLRIMSRKRVLAELQTYDTLQDTCKYLNIIRPEDRQFSEPNTATYLRTFALLLLFDRGKEIVKFIDEDVSDQNLPIHFIVKGRRQLKVFRRDMPDKPLTCFQEWKIHDIEGFESRQWQLLPQCFELEGGKVAKHYVLDKKTILPLRKKQEGSRPSGQPSGRGGGFGYVSTVEIEPSSHDFSDLLRKLSLKDDVFALKVLYDRIDNENKFRNEMEQLRRFNGSAHPHLVTLLSTFTISGRYHFIFPYAESNLEDYWELIEPNPKMDLAMVRWVSRQILGIVGAVAVIHDPKHLPDLTVDSKRYGRHGDIKPDNILWFRSSNDDKGVLVLTDMGLSDIHREQSKSGIPRYNIPKVPGYQPPECDVSGSKISRAYDIWTLGCLFLELITWLLGGWKLLDQFQEARKSVYHITGAVKHYFFTLKTIEGQRDKYAAQVKPEVTRWFRQLHNNKKCPQFIHDALDIIEREMLIVLYDGRNRALAEDLLKKFERIHKKCMNNNDPDYCLKGIPVRRPEREGTVVEVELNTDAEEAVLEYKTALPIHKKTDGEMKKSPLPKDLEEMEKVHDDKQGQREKGAG